MQIWGSQHPCQMETLQCSCHGVLHTSATNPSIHNTYICRFTLMDLGGLLWFVVGTFKRRVDTEVSLGEEFLQHTLSHKTLP